MSCSTAVLTAADDIIVDVQRLFTPAAVAENSSHFIQYLEAKLVELESVCKVGFSKLAYLRFLYPLAQYYPECEPLLAMVDQARVKMLAYYKDEFQTVGHATLRGTMDDSLYHMRNDRWVMPKILKYLYQVAFRGEHYFRAVLDFVHMLTDTVTSKRTQEAILLLVVRLKVAIGDCNISFRRQDIHRFHELEAQYLSTDMYNLRRLSNEQCTIQCQVLLQELVTDSHDSEVHHWLHINIPRCPADCTMLLVLYEVFCRLSGVSLRGQYPDFSKAVVCQETILLTTWPVVATLALSPAFTTLLLQCALNTLNCLGVVECLSSMVMQLGRMSINIADPTFFEKLRELLPLQADTEAVATLRKLLA